MKKILLVFLGFVPSFAMDPSAYEARLKNVEIAVAEIKDVLNDKTDSEGKTIPGLKSQVEYNTTIIKSLQGNIGSMSEGISTLTTSLTTSVNSLSSQIFDILNSISGIEEKINKGWDKFLEEKFQEYMEVKKKVLDIIAACKANGNPIPTYIVETADQLQAMNLEMRRLTLSEVLTKLNVFASLLNDEKLESLQTYLNNTSVPKPNLIGLQPTMPGITIEGEYIKVSGETRMFTRTSGFKTGLPKQGWMDQSCDYFAYGIRPVLERAINQENIRRNAINASIRLQNAKAQAAYDAGIQAAERASFPADDFTSLVMDYNRLLTRHEI